MPSSGGKLSEAAAAGISILMQLPVNNLSPLASQSQTLSIPVHHVNSVIGMVFMILAHFVSYFHYKKIDQR